MKGEFVPLCMMDQQKVIFRDLGRMDYREAWDYQETLLRENVRIKKTQEKRTDTTHYRLLFVRSIRLFIRWVKAVTGRIC